MIDTLYPYWGPPGTVYAEFPVDLVLGNCPPDMKEEILRCTQWSKLDSLEWVDKNWKEDKDKLEGIEAEEPPPAVLLYATKYIPVENSQNGAVAMTDYLRHAKGGWDLFPHQFISAIWELPAHHFGLFDKNMVRGVVVLMMPDLFLLRFRRSKKHRRKSGERVICWRKTENTGQNDRYGM